MLQLKSDVKEKKEQKEKEELKDERDIETLPSPPKRPNEGRRCAFGIVCFRSAILNNLW